MPLRCLSKRKSEKCPLNLVLADDLSERSFSVAWVGARGRCRNG